MRARRLATDAAASIAAILAATVSILPPRLAAAASLEEQKENCEEAARRFEQLYGKSPAGEENPVVLMYKHTFCPGHLVVKRGTAVRFLNIDRRTSHSFWFKDAGLPESERFFSGEGATMRIDLAPGEHRYLCGPHWEQEGMVGKITVTP